MRSIEHHLKNIPVIYLEYHGTNDEEKILAIISESHVVKQKKAVAQKMKKVNLELIGDICLDDVIVRDETILQAGTRITKTHIKELEKNSVETVLVHSDFLGEILFLNKSLALPK